MSFSCNIRVRTYELDLYQHVNNANYLNYLEHGRMEFLHAIGFDYKEFTHNGYGIYVTRIDIQYKRPAFLNDELTITCIPVQRKRLKGVLYQEIRRGDEVLIEAEVTYATVNQQGRPSPVPPEFELEGLLPETPSAIPQ